MTNKKINNEKLKEYEKEITVLKISNICIFILFMLVSFKKLPGDGIYFYLNIFSILTLIVFFIMANRLYNTLVKKKDIEIEIRNT